MTRRDRPWRAATVPAGCAGFALAAVAAVSTAVAASPPVITGPSGPVNRRPSYIVTGAPGSTISWTLCREDRCSLGSGPSPVATGPLPEADAPDGSYVLTTRALDAAASPTASVTFTLDRTAPAPPAGIAPRGPIASATPTFAWTPAEPGGSFAWELHAGAGPAGPLAAADTTAQTSAAPTAALAEGSYAFRVRQVDDAGNAGAWSAPQAVIVDLTPPAPPVIASPPPTDAAAAPAIAWTGGEPGGAFRWRLLGPDGGTLIAPQTTGEPAATLPRLAAGAYAVEVVALDAAGNASAPARLAFRLDAPPSVANLVLTSGAGQLALGWTLPPDPRVVAIRIVRRADSSPVGPADPAGTVLDVGADARSYVDRGLTAGRRYFYALYARTASGALSGVAATGSAIAGAAPPPGRQPIVRAATVPRPAVLPVRAPPSARRPARPAVRNAGLMRPAAGSLVRLRRPLLRWHGRPGGTVLFNLQIFDARGRKVHTAFPRTQRYHVPAGVLVRGRRYFWRVWPWRGPIRKFAPSPLGMSYFEYRATTAASRDGAGLRLSALRGIGTRIRFSLSRPARVRFSVRRVGDARPLGAFAVTGRRGVNVVSFRGRLNRRLLGPGRYAIAAVARAGRLTSRTVSTTAVVRDPTRHQGR